MQRILSWCAANIPLRSVVCVFLIFSSISAVADTKEWTLLVYLNGNNNLEKYGAININQMEKSGSSDKINVVAQWASLAQTVTKRILITKDNDPDVVTSPVVQTLPRVDMGDYRTLVDFVKWGVEHYPAKHYFVDIWNHGGGWHRDGLLSPLNISHDDLTDHSISTPELGIAVRQMAQIMGHKVDIVGTDACLMAMQEVNEEIAEAAEIAISSQEIIPGRGWPYDTFLARWFATPTANAVQVSKILTEEYLKSYSLPKPKRSRVTLSAVELAKAGALTATIAALTPDLLKLESADRAKYRAAVSKSLKFAMFDYDYVDLGDLVTNIGLAGISSISSDKLNAVKNALKEFVIDNKASPELAAASGVTIWAPSRESVFAQYAEQYEALVFEKQTRWGDAIKWLLN